MDKNQLQLVDRRRPATAPTDPAMLDGERSGAGHESQAGDLISSVMAHDLWTVDSQASIDMVEEILSTHGLSSVPVAGSNGEIIGIIGTHELAQFLVDGKNAKAVRAWEISRCTKFEVSVGDTITDVSKLMTENKIDYIAVTEHGRLRGVVSALGVLQAVLRENEHAKI